ncbi:hypothetical protein DEJ23_09855 [Curtobacterium sp. MCSS17_008]|uniref:hypothetical protein n=1 Tax=Curtobacterium sp. MCSS17_008 TaxID=2175647 RepID=UPI000DA9DB7F|nr:hypothetical protein [Curtobacterium sp. MCSS17_008]PZF56469.1 hypothetical protein DEJ23_09855 [Curtobacterium sp. MCSS17_008]
MAVPVPLGTEDRTPRLTLRRPDRWRRQEGTQSDLRLIGDDVVLTVRSRPSERTIAEEHTSLLERLPGSVDGLRLIGCDPWTTVDAPARLVEYVRPDEGGDVTGAHLLFVTGRHRVDVTVERPLARMLATDDLVSAVLESVRATEPAPARPQRELEPLPVAAPVPDLDGTRLGAEAIATLRSLAGRRWSPTLLRTPAGRELVQSGLVGRLGTLPESTQELLAPWAEDTPPVTLEQRLPDGRTTRLQAWSETVVDAPDETGGTVARLPVERVVALAAGRLGIRPSWTFPFRTASVGAGLLARRTGAPDTASELPAAVAEADPRLAAFWAAPWTVSSIRHPGRPTPVVVVHAEGIGFARVGRTAAGETAFRTDSPANVYRSVVRALLG